MEIHVKKNDLKTILKNLRELTNLPTSEAWILAETLGQLAISNSDTKRRVFASLKPPKVNREAQRAFNYLQAGEMAVEHMACLKAAGKKTSLKAAIASIIKEGCDKCGRIRPENPGDRNNVKRYQDGISRAKKYYSAMGKLNQGKIAKKAAK